MESCLNNTSVAQKMIHNLQLPRDGEFMLFMYVEELIDNAVINVMKVKFSKYFTSVIFCFG